METCADTSPRFYTLRASGAACGVKGGGGAVMLAIEACVGEAPRVLYFGPDMPGVDGVELALLTTSQHAPGNESVPVPATMMNAIGTGIAGPNGLLLQRGGHDWASDPRVVHVEVDAHALTVHCEDANTGIAVRHFLTLDDATGMLTCASEVENRGDAPLTVDWCAALCLPADQRLTRFLSFTGRWAGEFAMQEVDSFAGTILRENTAGRTSHDVFPGGVLVEAGTSEMQGLALGFHLAWSGNHRLRIDHSKDGQVIVQTGELLFPGEMELDVGETYRTPDMLVATSPAGLNGVSHVFHQHVRQTILDTRTADIPRPVHFNTWEAVYFNHSSDALIDLAKAAADVGAERFVLDDGWFGSRRNDRSGLGDWVVSDEVYPDGLLPLAEHVRSLGMDFGLWFEPEMVNPDSDLYRAHPDWVLKAPGVEPPRSRNQLTLDLTKPEVSDHLFNRISALVSDLEIAHIKWDMNRDTPQPASNGRAAMHRQTRALYALLARLRQAHPKLEIESCSSGGARADMGILRHTDRIWTSDNNDARNRHQIMRGASHFFPLRTLGNHVGPRTCHITGRQFSMPFRVASALFGHMGLELDLRDESEADLAILKAGIALHKRHRKLIHEGRFWRVETPADTNLVGCTARDQSQALFAYTAIEAQLSTHPRRIRFAGLDPDRLYRTRLVWPLHNPSVSTPCIIEAAGLREAGHVFTGAALMQHGIQPPLTHPDNCLIYYLEANA